MIKFGQKVEAGQFEGDDLEKAIAIEEEGGEVFCVWSPVKYGWVPRSAVQTSLDRWKEAHAEEIKQKRWKKAAEKAGVTLQEYVYRMEARRARLQAKKDPKEKQREYWRNRQQAHREKKAEADEQ